MAHLYRLRFSKIILLINLLDVCVFIKLESQNTKKNGIQLIFQERFNTFLNLVKD